jgi:GNAT superfamily N-acetyltransferase
LLLRSNVSRGSDNQRVASRLAAAGGSGGQRAGDGSGSRTLGGMATAAALCDLGPREFLGEIDVLLGIYADAMDADAALLPGRRELMRRHAGYPQFKALQARATGGGHDDGTVLGFSYGFHGAPGQWWYDAVSAALLRTIGPAATAGWLADCLEVAEVHVRKDQQRRGIGTRMLTALARGRAERTALLSTPDRESTARRLYRRMGFCDLLTGYSFPGGSPPYAVMGAVLPLRDPSLSACHGRQAPESDRSRWSRATR